MHCGLLMRKTRILIVFLATFVFKRKCSMIKYNIINMIIIITGNVKIHRDALLRNWLGPNGKKKRVCFVNNFQNIVRFIHDFKKYNNRRRLGLK